MLRLKLLRFFKRHWGFAFLVILSMAGVISNYKSNMWLLGWDNFSVNVDLPVNLGRTFWATWRDSRGLGVPSDSEVVDIFRQLLFVAFDVLLPKNNLITFYYLILYVTGILSTYWLIRIILTRWLRSPKPWLLELSSTLGA